MESPTKSSPRTKTQSLDLVDGPTATRSVSRTIPEWQPGDPFRGLTPPFRRDSTILAARPLLPPPLHSVRGHAAVGALEPDITACTLPDPPPLLPRAHEGAQPLCGSCASAGPRTVLVQHVRPLWPRRKHSVTHTRRHVLGRFAAHEARPALFALHGA